LVDSIETYLALQNLLTLRILSPWNRILPDDYSKLTDFREEEALWSVPLELVLHDRGILSPNHPHATYATQNSPKKLAVCRNINLCFRRSTGLKFFKFL
jgi:hypothetical protein